MSYKNIQCHRNSLTDASEKLNKNASFSTSLKPDLEADLLEWTRIWNWPWIKQALENPDWFSIKKEKFWHYKANWTKQNKSQLVWFLFI